MATTNTGFDPTYRPLFCPLASGSKGNSLYLRTPHTHLLIDAGLSLRSLEQRLAQFKIGVDAIDAILITHEHTDHVSALPRLASRFQTPIFSNIDTAKALLELPFKTKPPIKIFSTGEPFHFQDLTICPFSIQHDTLDPVGFVLTLEGGERLGICTDLGFVTSLVETSLIGCNHLYLEANHEPDLVHACHRPERYKRRVLSRQGHLSNVETAELLVKLVHPDLRSVYLAHLSTECNQPALAQGRVRDKMGKGLPFTLEIAVQDRVSRPVDLV